MPSMGPSVLVHDSSCTKSEFDTTLGSVTSPGAPIDMSSSIPTRRNLNRQKTHNLHLLNVNWRSINNRHRQFQNMIDSNNPDIMVITESWLSPNQADGEIAEDGHFSSDYTIHQCDQGYCHMQQSKKYTVHRLRTRRHCHGMGQVRSQQCQITLCWSILPPECQEHRWSLTHDGLRVTSEQPDSLAYMANGQFQPAQYRLVPGHHEHQEQHQTQRKPWGISWHARCCSSHPDCQGTNQRWEHPGPLLNQQRDPHHRMYSNSRDIRPRCCTNREQTKTQHATSPYGNLQVGMA